MFPLSEGVLYLRQCRCISRLKTSIYQVLSPVSESLVERGDCGRECGTAYTQPPCCGIATKWILTASKTTGPSQI